MKRPSLRLLAVLSAVGLLALGGTAAAFLLRGMRDVTTSSTVAYRHYQAGLESEHKLYHREAIAEYAQALAADPAFVMAAVRLAGQLAGRDPERARWLVESATRRLDGLSEREKLTALMSRADFVTKDRKEMEALVEEYTRRFPDDPEGLIRKAAVLRRNGKSDEALAFIERAIEIDPNRAWAYNTLGYEWMARKDYGKAEDYLKRYRYLAPDQANPYDSLGELYSNIGRYEEAEESLRKALLIKPDFHPATAHLGTVAVGRGDYAEAAKQYLRAAEATDGLKERLTWAYPAALSLADAGRPEEAVAAYDRLIAGVNVLPEDDRKALDSELQRLRSILLASAGRSDEAEAALARVTFPAGDAPDEKKKDFEQMLSVARGVLARSRGDHEAAVELLKKGQRPFEAGAGGFPYYPYAHRIRITLAQSLIALGRVEEAREALAPILAVNPRYEPALAVLAQLPPANAAAS